MEEMLRCHMLLLSRIIRLFSMIFNDVLALASLTNVHLYLLSLSCSPAGVQKGNSLLEELCRVKWSAPLLYVYCRPQAQCIAHYHHHSRARQDHQHHSQVLVH